MDAASLVYVHTWHLGADSVFDETRWEEAEVFVEEGETELPQTEDSRTTDLPAPEELGYTVLNCTDGCRTVKLCLRYRSLEERRMHHGRRSK